MKILLVLFFLLGCLCQNPSSIPKIFEGEWQLQVTRFNKGEPAPEDTMVLMNVSFKNNVHNAVYTDWENDKNFRIKIDWTTFASGSVLLWNFNEEEPEEEVEVEEVEEVEEDTEETRDTLRRVVKREYDDNEEGALLFAFDFNNRTNGNLYSYGEFKEVIPSEKGYYQFLIPTPHSFSFTIWKSNEEIILVTGVKNVPAVEQSFFQKYFIYFALAMFGMRFLLPSPQQQPTPQAAARPRTPTAT
jgi:hypothetical protein